MKKVKIIAVPPGQAPEWVRQRWIGAEIPLYGSPEGYDGELSGVMDGTPSSENAGGYDVLVEDALTALEQLSQEAANWWRNEWPMYGFINHFVFAKHVCELIG